MEVSFPDTGKAFFCFKVVIHTRLNNFFKHLCRKREEHHAFKKYFFHSANQRIKISNHNLHENVIQMQSKFYGNYCFVEKNILKMQLRES